MSGPALAVGVGVGVLAALGTATHAFGVGDGPQPPEPAASQHVVLRFGDTLRVEGADLGCQVARRDGRITIECRRVGVVKRTYGTFIDERGAVVARFRARDTARVVFNARHGGGWRTCGSRSPKRPTAHMAAPKGCR